MRADRDEAMCGRHTSGYWLDSRISAIKRKTLRTFSSVRLRIIMPWAEPETPAEPETHALSGVQGAVFKFRPLHPFTVRFPPAPLPERVFGRLRQGCLQPGGRSFNGDQPRNLHARRLYGGPS